MVAVQEAVVDLRVGGLVPAILYLQLKLKSFPQMVFICSNTMFLVNAALQHLSSCFEHRTNKPTCRKRCSVVLV
jgi:hypothetical protein